MAIRVTSPPHLDFDGTDRFRVRRRLGEGAMGVVYEVEDLERNSRVALKTLRHGDANYMYRLKQEFQSGRPTPPSAPHLRLDPPGLLPKRRGES